MGQVYFQNIPPLVKASSTTCTLAATHLGQPTRIQIGGQAYKLSSTLTLNTATTGLGGLDTGALGSAQQLYYVYACANTSGVVGLVASLTGPSTGPSGFAGRYKWVGAFYVQDTAVIGSTVTIDGEATTDWISFTPSLISGATGGTFGGFWKRKGDSICSVATIQSPTTWAGVALDMRMFPSVFSLDLAKLSASTVSERQALGTVLFVDDSASTRYQGEVVLGASANNSARFWSSAGADVWALGASRPVLGQNGADALHLETKLLPISGWSKTLLG